MAADEGLVHNVREALSAHKGVTEKRMFGGICFMLRGNMLCGVSGTGRYMFRVGKEQEAEGLSRPGAESVVFNGRKMGGFLYVDPLACDDDALAGWIALSDRFVGAMPPK